MQVAREAPPRNHLDTSKSVRKGWKKAPTGRRVQLGLTPLGPQDEGEHHSAWCSSR